MTFTSHRALELQRDASYLIECIERKREVLGDHALDLDHAIKSLRRNCERVEEEFGRWLDECNKASASYAGYSETFDRTGHCDARR